MLRDGGRGDWGPSEVEFPFAGPLNQSPRGTRHAQHGTGVHTAAVE